MGGGQTNIVLLQQALKKVVKNKLCNRKKKGRMNVKYDVGNKGSQKNAKQRLDTSILFYSSFLFHTVVCQGD